MCVRGHQPDPQGWPLSADKIWNGVAVSMGCSLEAATQVMKAPCAVITAQAGLTRARGQVCFFVPYLSLASNGAHGTDDLYSFGKIVFLGVVGAVSLEVPR